MIGADPEVANMLPIRIAVGDLSLDGELNDTESARAVAGALPLTVEFQVWGDELHFDVPVELDRAARPAPKVNVGDVGLWAEGKTLCIFFGPTPMSEAEEPVSAVPVTVVGHVERAERLREAKEGKQITVTSSS